MADELTKWISSSVRYCEICRQDRRHDIGVLWKHGKQYLVRECVACHEVSRSLTKEEE